MDDDGWRFIMSEKPKRDPRPLPGINIQELIAERNWVALGGLALIALGVLYMVQDVLGIDFNLWSVALVGLGGWLMIDGWQSYQDHHRTWVGASRNRVVAGAVIALVGLVSVLDISGWTLFLLVIAGVLGYDARQKYEANGRVWTEPARTRMIAAAVIGVIGLFGLLNLWSTWPLLLIVLGAVMLFGRGRRR
jgi:hypothetical protein